MHSVDQIVTVKSRSERTEQLGDTRCGESGRGLRMLVKPARNDSFDIIDVGLRQAAESRVRGAARLATSETLRECRNMRKRGQLAQQGRLKLGRRDKVRRGAVEADDERLRRLNVDREPSGNDRVGPELEGLPRRTLQN